MQDAGWTTRARRGDQNGRTRQGGMCLLILAAAVTASMSATVRATGHVESVVQIHPYAVVTSATVLLNDIATLSGDDARLAGGWAVTSAPAPGKETIIDADAIQQVLVRRGINASKWIFRGSTKCRISRPMRTASSTESTDSSANLRASRLGHAERNEPTLAPAGETALGSVQPAMPDEDTLEGVIYKHIAERISALGGRPSIQVSPGIRDLMRLGRPTYDFSIQDRGERLLGLLPLEITVYRDGKIDQVQSTFVNVSLVKPVVVAAGPINRGQAIRSEDVTLREQKFERVDHVAISDPNAVIGQRAVRLISRDEMLAGKDIEPVPLILRNDLVTVSVKRGRISIKATAKALKSAGYGEMVELRNESSKETFVALVTGVKTAELVTSTMGAGQTPAQAVTMLDGRN